MTELDLNIESAQRLQTCGRFMSLAAKYYGAQVAIAEVADQLMDTSLCPATVFGASAVVLSGVGVGLTKFGQHREARYT